MPTFTSVLPCDNKRLLGGLKSILGVFLVDSDSASRSGQLIRADHSCQHSATSCQHSATSCHHRPPADRPQLGTGHTLGQHWAQLGNCHQANGFTYIALVCQLKKALQYKQPALYIIPDQIYMFI